MNSIIIEVPELELESILLGRLKLDIPPDSKLVSAWSDAHVTADLAGQRFRVRQFFKFEHVSFPAQDATGRIQRVKRGPKKKAMRVELSERKDVAA